MMKRVSLSIAALTLLTACAGEPTIQTGPDAEVSFDGLVRIDNARFAGAWIDPDVDLSRFKKILPGGARFEFRSVDKVSTSEARRSNQREFFISEKDQQRLEEVMLEIFDEELARSDIFSITDQPGVDVMLVRGALLDIVSYAPPDIRGRGEIYLDQVGAATLVIEVVDSLTGEVVARAIERRAAEPAGRMGVQSTSVTNWQEVRRLARRWARTLREGLEALVPAA
jgi:hypothetical protein